MVARKIPVLFCVLLFSAPVLADGFKLVMPGADGLLSHLQFEQDEPKRELFRHCSEDEIQSLKEGGFLRLSKYFDEVCRPVLVEALREDGWHAEADRLARPDFTFFDFSEMMKEKHSSPDPFGLMKTEFKEERAVPLLIRIICDEGHEWEKGKHMVAQVIGWFGPAGLAALAEQLDSGSPAVRRRAARARRARSGTRGGSARRRRAGRTGCAWRR